MHVYNPENFEPSIALPLLLRPFGDCARMLVHLILLRQSEQGLDEQEYVPLKATILRKQIHATSTEAIRDSLRSTGVIECDDRFCPGLKCLGFRLGPQYRRR